MEATAKCLHPDISIFCLKPQTSNLILFLLPQTAYGVLPLTFFSSCGYNYLTNQPINYLTFFCFCALRILAHVSRRVTVRLNTRDSGVESLESTQK